jgi:hypothetical protein
MSFCPARTRLMLLAIFLCAASPLLAAPTGPTLQFDYGHGQPLDNPLGKFMYFVPLISPEQVSVFTNAGNTQCARVTSFRCRTNGVLFHATCEFDFDGDGLQRSVFDHAANIHRREKELQAGKPLAHQLAAINVHGTGSGSVEIDGTLTNGQSVVTEMRLRFNSRGHPSPVSVSLEDIVLRNGEIQSENEMVARVNTLTFRQKSPPKMEVTLASVKKKDAGDGHWQNFVGGIKGVAANLLLPPLTITPDGQEAMLNFGLALATQKASFTFPFATRMKDGSAIKQTAELR